MINVSTSPEKIRHPAPGKAARRATFPQPLPSRVLAMKLDRINLTTPSDQGHPSSDSSPLPLRSQVLTLILSAARRLGGEISVSPRVSLFRGTPRGSGSAVDRRLLPPPPGPQPPAPV